MEAKLYPENLKGLNLSFIEAIYAIAFGLESEVRAHGKEKVFQELGMTETEMTTRVDYCLNEVMYSSYAYALRRVLGDLESSANDGQVSYRYDTLATEFNVVMKDLRSSEANCRVWGRKVNYRNLLTKSKISNTQGCKVESLETSKDTEWLYAQVQQLMNEVRVYNEKRDQALAKIEALMIQIQQRKDCPKYFGKDQSGVASSRTVMPSDAVMQIFWPYRSAAILQKLRLNTVGEVVEYFQDFRHFVDECKITLMEWLVITAILRNEGLLSKEYEIFELSSKIDELDFSVRTFNCLRRSGINKLDDMISWFADGAADGWHDIKRISQLGIRSCEEIICKLGKIAIKMDDSFCFLTPESSVYALDFGRDDRSKLQCYDLETIGDLMAACQDENRFLGLRYIDNELYQEAKTHLSKYGCDY